MPARHSALQHAGVETGIQYYQVVMSYLDTRCSLSRFIGAGMTTFYDAININNILYEFGTVLSEISLQHYGKTNLHRKPDLVCQIRGVTLIHIHLFTLFIFFFVNFQTNYAKLYCKKERGGLFILS